MWGTEDELTCWVQKMNFHVGYRRRTYVWGTEDELMCGVQEMNLRVGYRI